jgi:hypothetical protein
MSDTIYFSEKQKFNIIWIILGFLAFGGVFIYGIYQQVICHIPFGTKPMPDAGLYIGLAVVAIMALIFASFKLDTQIKEDGIYYRFFPLQIKMRKIAWNEISHAYVRQYKPVREYGGWGMRIGIFGKGRSLSFSGNKGIQLVRINKRRLLIGTQKMEEAKAALLKVGKYNAE